jgi:hypothetical protein
MRSVGWTYIYFLKMNGGLLIQVCQNQIFHIQRHHELVYPKAFEINHVVMLKFKDDLHVMLPRSQASNSIGIVMCNFHFQGWIFL